MDVIKNSPAQTKEERKQREQIETAIEEKKKEHAESAVGERTTTGGSTGTAGDSTIVTGGIIATPEDIITRTPPVDTSQTVDEKIREAMTGGGSTTMDAVTKAEQRDIQNIPIEPDYYQKDEYIVPAMTNLEQHGITRSTFGDYDYVEISGRRFYSNTPGSYNALLLSTYPVASKQTRPCQ